MESLGYTDVQTESYIRSAILASQSGPGASGKPTALNNNFFNKAPVVKHYENDPLSLISIFAKKHGVPQPSESKS